MWSKLSHLPAILGLLGVSLSSFLDHPFQAHIAAAAIALLCLFLACYGAWTLRKWQKQIYSKGYKPIATFVRYSTVDGKVVTHETFRQIQIKFAYLNEIEHKYRWSGSHAPDVTSLMQKVSEPVLEESSGFQVRKIRFERPRFFNETEVVHLHSTMNDVDGRSEPYVSLLVDLPIAMVQFRVELLHCVKINQVGMTAFFERKRKTVTRSEYEPVTTVAFDPTSRAFQYLLNNPEPGYEYRLRWEKQAQASPRRGKKAAATKRSASKEQEQKTEVAAAKPAMV